MKLTKDEIVRVIRRTAESNGGAPLGEIRLASEAGIRKADWQHFWARLADAHAELGFTKNELKKAYAEKFILDKYTELAKQLGRLPTKDDLDFVARSQNDFPNKSVYYRRYKTKEGLVRALEKHCGDNVELAAIRQLCRQYKPKRQDNEDINPTDQNAIAGYVYLLRHGSRREYRIGQTRDPLRRLGRNDIAAPEGAAPVHTIGTDDPEGVEKYWHTRFAGKRLRKEADWFALDAADIAAFKRRKQFM